jgi:hypothetical protein
VNHFEFENLRNCSGKDLGGKFLRPFLQ